jgi:hypothetical protein
MRAQVIRPPLTQPYAVGISIVMSWGVAMLLSLLLSAEAMADLCQSAPKELKALQSRLERSERARAWREIYSALVQRRDTLIDREDDIGALLCIERLSAEAAFYLSDSPNEGALWSVKSLGHLLQIQAKTPLDQRSTLLTTDLIEYRKILHRRLRSALSRYHKKDSSLERTSWLMKEGETAVSLPSLSRPVSLIISPPDQLSWSRACGLSKECQKPIEWTLSLKPNRGLTLSLPRGRYALHWSGPCADTQTELKLDTETLSLKPPALKCISKLIARDALNQQLITEQISVTPRKDPPQGHRPPDAQVTALTPTSIPEGAEVQVNIPGYISVNATAPQLGEPLEVQLQRCYSKVQWEVSPSHAEVKAPKNAYWGTSYTARVSALGYQTVTRLFDLPRPENCSPAPLKMKVALSREVTLKLLSPEKIEVAVDHLEVGGIPVRGRSPTLIRPPGQYMVTASAQGYKTLKEELVIPPCLERGSSVNSCRDLSVEFSFERPLETNLNAADVLKKTGLTFIGMSAVLGTYAYLGGDRYQELVRGRALNPQRESVKEVTGWATGLLLSGALSYTLGQVWPNLSSSPIDSKNERGLP